ncbi:MAG: cytochrome P450 [Marmoricola sp.]
MSVQTAVEAPPMRTLAALRGLPQPLRVLQGLAGGEPVVRLGPRSSNCLLAASPDAVRHVLRRSNDGYAKPGFVKKGQVGILVSDGDEWSRHRRLVQQAFGPGRIDAMTTVIRSVVDRTADRWAAVASARGTLDVLAEMRSLSWQLICELVLGDAAENRDLTGRLWTAVRTSHVDQHPLAMMVRGSVSANPQRPAALELGLLIAQRRWEPDDGVTLLSALVHARDAESGEGFTDQEVYDEVLSLLTAGHETTADTLTWAWSLLAGSPSAAAPRQVLNESLRLYPPIWLFARTAVEADIVAGTQVRPGATVFISPWLLHHDPRLWTDPERFEPSRFDPATPPPSRFTFLPFGAGPRVCVGSRLAMLEMEVALTVLASVANLSLVGRPPAPRTAVTLRPRGPMMMSFQPPEHR